MQTVDEQVRYRLPVDLANGGFLLSPVIEDALQFARLLDLKREGALEGEYVKQIKFETWIENSGLFLESKVGVKFERLEVPRRDLSQVAGVRDQSVMKNLQKSLLLGEAQPTVAVLVGGPVLVAHAPARLLLPVPEGARKLHLTFGLPEPTYTQEPPTDGATFRVVEAPLHLDDARSPTWEATNVMWSFTLRPTTDPADRGDQQALIDLGSTPSPFVILETLPAGNSAHDWTYWSKVSFVFQSDD